MQLVIADGDPFNRFDRCAFNLRHRHQTTVDQLPIDQNTARPAFAFAATFLRPGEVQLLAQNVEQPFHRKRFKRSWLTVYCAFDFLGHACGLDSI
jgi:hypothetical protein